MSSERAWWCSMIVEGGIWIFGFAVLAIFISVFRFCVKNLRFFSFSVHCGLRIFHILAFGFRFSRKIPTGFRNWYPMRFSVFPNWPTVFGFQLLFDLSGNITRPHWSRETQMLLRGMRDKPIEISQGSLGGSRVLNDAHDFDHPKGFTRLEWRPRLWPCNVEHLGQGRSVCEPCLPTCQTRRQQKTVNCWLCRVFFLRRGERRREFQRERQV